ncbi:MAG: SDR family oxidoreductase [Cyclobacteriaceae bacterium]|jgi:NAD(P)-dependent dehydrogenase (short-subunit alcohol dehydrogenase family)|nr:SDR family oxidoreductase [Cyclobacteriaceae bacterium]
MDLHLKHKVVLVSGGARGIGRAVVDGLLEESAVPVILDKNYVQDAQLKSYQVDLTSAEACREVITQISNEFGIIDGIVNNAGFNDSIGLEKGTPEEFIQSLTNNIGHYYYLVHYALPWLKKSKGSIVNIGSKTSVTGQGNTSGYVAAKGGILALTREWAVELLPYSIRVNAVIPAEVATPLYEAWINNFADPKQKLQEITRNIPLEHRLTKPEEIAATVLFLLSDRSSHTTGQWIFVDGGYTHLDRSIR